MEKTCWELWAKQRKARDTSDQYSRMRTERADFLSLNEQQSENTSPYATKAGYVLTEDSHVYMWKYGPK
jgi:hypothetical protein